MKVKVISSHKADLQKKLEKAHNEAVDHVSLQLEAADKLVYLTLSKYLGREPNEDDQKYFDNNPLGNNNFDLYYKNVKLGKLETSAMGVRFLPCKAILRNEE